LEAPQGIADSKTQDGDEIAIQEAFVSKKTARFGIRDLSRRIVEHFFNLMCGGIMLSLDPFPQDFLD